MELIKWVLLSSLTLGCVSSVKFHDKVIERNKEHQPPWVELSVNSFHSMDGKMAFVGFKDNIVDLPHGIKQAQVLTLEYSYMALHKKIINQILELASEDGFEVKVTKQMNELVARAAKSRHKQIKVVDIYYEKYIRSGMNSSVENVASSVYVLAYFPSKLFDQVLDSSAASFSQTKSNQLKRLARLIQAHKKVAEENLE